MPPCLVHACCYSMTGNPSISAAAGSLSALVLSSTSESCLSQRSCVAHIQLTDFCPAPDRVHYFLESHWITVCDAFIYFICYISSIGYFVNDDYSEIRCLSLGFDHMMYWWHKLNVNHADTLDLKKYVNIKLGRKVHLRTHEYFRDVRCALNVNVI